MLNSYDSDSEDEEGYIYRDTPISLENEDVFFKDKYFLPFFRGLHATKNSFRDKSARRQFIKTSRAGKDFYSSDVYESYREEENEQRLVLAKKIQTLVKVMECFCGVTIGRKYYENYKDYVQELYTNDYDKFHDFLRNEKSTFREEQKKLGICITKNYNVSTSDLAEHAYKYAYGLKYLGKDVIKIIPDYDAIGRPKHPYLGKIIAILIPFEALQELNPAFVLNLYAKGSIRVSTHFAKDILTEREITFPGYIPGQYVALDLPVRVPSFHKNWEHWYLDKYGLSQSKFKKLKSKILATKGQSSQQKNLVKKFMEIIYQELEQKLVEKISTFLKSKQAHLRWKGLNSLCEVPLSIKDAKKEREAHILKYTEPYERNETVPIEYLDFNTLKILTESIKNNRPIVKVSIDKWNYSSLSSFLRHSMASHLEELALHNFNVMNEVYQNLDVLRDFIQRNRTLRLLSLIGTKEEYEEDYNNKYGISPGHPLYKEDPTIRFGEFFKEIINKSLINVLDLSENDLPESAMKKLKHLTKSGRKVEIIYCQDRELATLENHLQTDDGFEPTDYKSVAPPS